MTPSRILAPALTTVALLALAGCGDSTPTVSQSKVEDRISSGLEQQVGQAPDDISCPGDLKGEQGQTMTCTLTAGQDQLDVTVTVTSVDGNTVNFDYEVAQMDDSGSGS